MMQSNEDVLKKTYSDIDWNAIWKDRHEKNTKCRGRGDCASIWASREKASTFLKMSRERPERIQKDIDGLKLNSSSKVLDIGSGPGTLAVPMAARAAHVTAVEPALGMAEVMNEYAKESNVSNLKIVRKRWEDVDSKADLDGPYDVVVARHSLGMPDIRSAIESMCEVSSGWVYLFWFAGTTSWERMMFDLWPALHDKEYRSGPKADVLYNVLYSMGIYPNMETVRMEYNRRFQDIDAAVKEFKDQYDISSDRQEEILREHLSKTFTKTEDGIEQSGTTTQVKFWWNVDGHV